MSISNYAENALLDTLRNTSFSVANTYVKLHTGDPGETGSSNAATETTRKAVTWSAASSGSMASSATLEWTNVSTTETYSHWSLWDNSTAGNCLWTGALNASAAVTAGDTFQITSLTLSLD
jgi:hypothetical protein